MSPKYVRAIVIGFAVALVTGVALNVLLHGTGRWIAIFAGVMTAYLLSNLAGNRKIADASDADKRAALERRPPSGKALVYLYREGFVAKLAGLDLKIDGRPVAQLKSPRFTCVAVPAGSHVISGRFGGLAGAQSKFSELTIQAPADGVVCVRIGVSMGLLQGSLQMTVAADTAAAMRTLATLPMTPADVAEL